tara:strand:+ start:65 stop:1093 length:1029 start_codon:yes stop_codon:yes gene_type:complete
MEKLNWGIIGLGRIAERFSEGFSDVKNARLLSVASKDLTKLDRYKNKYKIQDRYLFNSYEELINCDDIDIVYVALPNSLHHKWVLEIIKKNKNILVEKPATVSFSEADSIKNKLIGKDLFFAEAFMYRYLPQTKSLVDILEHQEIGDLFSMNSCFGINLLTKKKFLFFNKKKKINPKDIKFNKEMGGGSIYDLGCYPSSMSLLINSIISETKNENFQLSNISREIGETGVDVNASAEIFFENGFNSNIFSSFNKNLGNQTEIKGEKGKIILQDTWKGKNIIIELINKKQKEINFENKRNIYSFQIEAISNTILNGIKNLKFPNMSIKETLINMKIIERWLNG